MAAGVSTGGGGNAMVLGLALGLFCQFMPVGGESPPVATGGLERFEFESKHMGTTFRVVLYAADRETAEKAKAAAFARVAEFDAVMSDYKKDSELMRLCRAFSREVGEPVPVSEELFFVLAKTEELSK